MAKKKKKVSNQYVVTSKVKEAIKGKGMRTSGDAVDALNAEVDELIKRAIDRCKDNNRQTVRAADF
jgi:hypothetical protein